MRAANLLLHWSGLALSAALLLSLRPGGVVAAEQPKQKGKEAPKQEAKTYKVKAVKNVAYYEGDDSHSKKHKLDLYVPEGVKDFPVLFFVHGGAWISGDKDFFGIYETFAKTYAKQGIGVVVTNYRLSPSVKHPEHVKDVARAVAWTYNNVKKHGGNPDAIVLAGHSAGAHLVALVTTDASYLKALKVDTKVIKGVVPISGPYDIPNGALKNVFGPEAQKASPLRFVREGLPPFLILYADKDMVGCDKAPSEAFCKALKAKKVAATTVEVKNSNHLEVIVRAGTADSETFEAIVEFVRKQAK
jgi:acetyl esterase/lipase